MACCGRSLDSPCTLALLVGFQFAFVLYFSLGGFRGLVSVLVHTTEPEFDYSRPHDVYTNLSHLGAPPPPPRNSGTGPPATGPPLKDCQIPSPLLVGPVSVHLSSPLSLEEIRQRNPLVSPGGRYRPPDCEPHHHTAIVVPYRNRQTHLRALLYHLHPFLQRQQIHYSIYIVQQWGNGTFNRAKLLNVGVREALRDEDWSCIFLHDVDLLPENDHNIYTCHKQFPTHLSVAMDKFRYRLPYPQYFGGVSAVTPDQYMKMNGFPNQYWGWGGEDDDIAARVRLSGMKILRPPVAIGHYKMIKHKGDRGNEQNPRSKVNPKQATRVTSSQDGGYGLQSEEVILTPEDENPLRRILQPFKWHHAGMSHSKRKLLQSLMGPYGPLSVSYNGKTCILFKAKRLAIRYRNHTFIDLTERVFNPNSPVDTKGSICTKEKATLSLRFGDVEDLRGLVIRLQMSNTFYEAAGQNWFTLDSVHIHYNWTQEATFNASEVYAPATSSYHCQHVSSLHKYDTLLVPSSHTDTSANWHITFTDFQIQAFNVQSDKFASASDCATFLTPAILMGLVTSLILLLVLAYALHMVVHLKHIDRYEEHKATVYFPRSPEAELPDKNSL